MSDIKLKAKEKGGIVTVKALMNHPMETGQRKDKEGKKIPAHFITDVIATVGDTEVANAKWGASISKNPYFAFDFAGSKGDTIKLTWKDNKGESESAETEIK